MIFDKGNKQAMQGTARPCQSESRGNRNQKTVLPDGSKKAKNSAVCVITKNREYFLDNGIAKTAVTLGFL